MNEFVLNLASWKTEVPEVITKNDPSTNEEVKVYSGKTVEEDYPIRDNLQTMLRASGVFQDINDVAEAVYLAHQIRDADADEMFIEIRQIKLLKQCLDAHLRAVKEGRGQ